MTGEEKQKLLKIQTNKQTDKQIKQQQAAELTWTDTQFVHLTSGPGQIAHALERPHVWGQLHQENRRRQELKALELFLTA